MRKIFQHIDLVEILIRPGETSVYLPQDRIFVDKEINRIFLLSGEECSKYVTGYDVVPAEFLDFVYLDLYEENQQIINRNLSARLLRPACNIDVKLNCILDYNLSEIKILPNTILQPDKTYSLLLAFEYQTRLKEPFVEPTNTYLINVPFQQGKKQFYKLSNFGTYALSGKKIRRITAEGNSDCFLSIRERSGKVFNQIPLYMLKAFINSENTYFDNIDIDFDNSFVETLNFDSPLSLTFYYN